MKDIVSKVLGNRQNYLDLLADLSLAAENAALPVNIYIKPNACLTMLDLQDFCNKFKTDTGLEIAFVVFTDEEGNLCFAACVSEEDEEDDDEYYLLS